MKLFFGFFFLQEIPIEGQGLMGTSKEPNLKYKEHKAVKKKRVTKIAQNKTTRTR
jgi:hypothetical protein